jgi:hypothetical protein
VAEVPEPTVRVTRYEVSCLPETDVNHRYFKLHVEFRGGGKWAVCQPGMLSFCLSVDGTWDPESAITDEWIATHRFDKDTALRLAREHAPRVEINGLTVAEVVARSAARG